jgi:hypothetical protein
LLKTHAHTRTRAHKTYYCRCSFQLCKCPRSEKAEGSAKKVQQRPLCVPRKFSTAKNLVSPSRSLRPPGLSASHGPFKQADEKASSTVSSSFALPAYRGPRMHQPRLSSCSPSLTLALSRARVTLSLSPAPARPVPALSSLSKVYCRNNWRVKDIFLKGPDSKAHTCTRESVADAILSEGSWTVAGARAIIQTPCSLSVGARLA